MEKKYITKWENIIKGALLALENKDFSLYDNLISKANIIVEDMKKDESLTYKCDNFGISNYIFEDALPNIFKHNKNIIKEFINTIKDDKNLLNQFKFYKALENYSLNDNAIDYINESLKLFYKNVNLSKISESNKKLAVIIEKYKIKPNNIISEDKQKFFKQCDFLFKNEKSLSNLSKINETINEVSEYIKQKNSNLNETNNNKFYHLIDDYNNKYRNLLTHEEKEIIKNVLTNNKDEKEKIFNKLKKECVDTISNLINDSTNNEVIDIKNRVNEMKFNNENIVNDIIKLLEIKSIIES